MCWAFVPSIALGAGAGKFVYLFVFNVIYHFQLYATRIISSVGSCSSVVLMACLFRNTTDTTMTLR